MGHENWKIVVLNMDDEASYQIAELIKDLYPDITEVRKISNKLAHASKNAIRKAIRKSVKVDEEQKVLTLYSSGGMHHYTYGLCREVADKRSESYAYFHFDHHPDYGYSSIDRFSSIDRKILNCGAFVRHILRDSNAQALRYVGCRSLVDDEWCSSDVEKIGKTYDSDYKDRLECNGVEKTMERLLQNTPNDVYISMDLDVLKPEEIQTSYGNGPLLLDQLLESLDGIKRRKNIVSADALGYTTIGGRHEKSLLAYARIVEMVTDNGLDLLQKPDILKKISKRLNF